ncbi:hypothetical protein [Oribacterium sp. WCC10]|uniref:hypothetical protein n=1 Tax=Oribacterium sp. WCC10 TaxID=1855343 RepID=UPI0008EA3C36|nr:hypothetical protein [Oribacterium sp. WCC10]SFG27020.1 hypothetical protein SAMN05216356_104178 [Oribacterium sp. WCC10]
MKKMNLIRKIVAVGTVAALSLSMAAASFAGSFETDSTGIWYKNDDGSFPKGVWQWIDADGDGKFQCYAFDENGYVYSNTTTPDGYSTAADGSWIKDGVAVVRTVADNLSTSEIVKNVKAVINHLNGVENTSESTSETTSTGASTQDVTLTVGQITVSNVTAGDIVTKKHTVKRPAAAAGTEAEETGPNMNKTSFDTNGPSVPADAETTTVAPTLVGVLDQGLTLSPNGTYDSALD